MDIALLGLVLPGVENHSLAALRRPLAEAGLAVQVVPFQGWGDFDETLAAVLALRPRICGLSIQTTEAALASLALVRVLRGRGFRGQIVCGGHYATLNAADIVASAAGVDVVVRFAGQRALLALARGEALESVPGAVYRDPDGAVREGAPADTDPQATRSDEPLPVHLGFPSADVISSRGCEAHCSYCCVAGISDLARAEAARAGAVVPRFRRRSVEAIADELAWLWHDRGARVINFMDDNLLPLDPVEAEDFVATLGRALAARRVGRFACSLQLRADVATPAVVDGLCQLGLARAYVGIDGYSPVQLRALGRHAAADAGPTALAALASRGVFAICNALLIGPTIRFESIQAELAAFARIRDVPLHLLPIDVRAGTAYHESAQRRGLLEGGFLWKHYRFEDPRTELLAEIVTSLPTRLEEHSVPIGLYDLGYNLGIARRLLPTLDVSALAARYTEIARAWNADQLRILGLATKVAARLDRPAAQALLRRERPIVRAHDEALLAGSDAALAELERLATQAARRPMRAHARGRLLSAVALSLGLAACGGESQGGRDAAVGDAGFDAATVVDARTDDAGLCADGRQQAAAPYLDCNACGSMASLTLTFDQRGEVVAIDTTADGGAITSEMQDCLQALFQGSCYPSLANTRQEVRRHCWVA